MRKIIGLFGLVLALGALVACNGKEKLYLLNWGEYMSEDVIAAFEAEYNCKVVQSPVTSNELMYTDIAQDRRKVDVLIPSDYMIEKMVKENLLLELDFELLPNYDESIFVPELAELMNEEGVEDYKSYYAPYFWGSLAIMYSNNKETTKTLVEENGWSILFDKNINSGLRVGMYASSRDSFAAAALYKDIDLNTTNREDIDMLANTLKAANFAEWGTDDLKSRVVSGVLDVALVYSGDFFDSYYTAEENDNEIDFGVFAPQDYNNVFFDGMVISKNSLNPGLAHSFINFLLEHENALDNAYYVGYCPTVDSVYKEILEDVEMASVVAYDAYHPRLITQPVVYRDLGSTTFIYLEDKYSDVRGS